MSRHLTIKCNFSHNMFSAINAIATTEMMDVVLLCDGKFHDIII